MRLDFINEIRTALGSPFSRKNLVSALSAALLVLLLVAYYRFLPFVSRYLKRPEFLALGILVFLSVLIMIFWLNLGVFGGLGTFLLALTLLHRPLASLEPSYYIVLVTSFFIASCYGYYFYRKISIADQEHDLTVEKLEEDLNLIRNHLKRRNAEVSAMGEKMASLLKLKNIADKLSLLLSEEEVVKMVTEECHALMSGEGIRILFFRDDLKGNDFLLVNTVKDEGRKDFPRDTGGTFGRWVQKNMKSLLVKDVSTDFRFSVDNEEKADDAVSLIIKPMIVENRVLGMLRADSPSYNAFTQYQLRLLDIIGGLAGVALENARLYQQTENLAITDSLTGLYVHRYFMERIDEEVKRAVHSGGRFAILMIDIDGFKTFNDEHGHITGDAMLKSIGSILKELASPGDCVARYGGEEFVFLALNLDRSEAFALAENIRERISDTPVELRREEYRVTVSVGLSVFPDDGQEKHLLIETADKYLYKAKEEGKDRVCAE